MATASLPARIAVRVDPALAEAAVWGVLSRLAATESPQRARHDRRAARAYDLDDPVERDREFAALARIEFDELGLADPLVSALDERPALAVRARVLLVGQARSGQDEGVTCEPRGEHVGFRIDPGRFADPATLARWARHALGHAEDTLDPAFGFVPGWDGDGRGAHIRTAAQARLHRLWDISVDGRVARRGSDGESTRTRHLERLRADLPGASAAAVAAALDRLWSGPRPDFATLLQWAERPASVLDGLASDDLGAVWPDRCPLCRFPSDDVRPPRAVVAAHVAADYPWWHPELGICGRCDDRYRLGGRLGGSV